MNGFTPDHWAALEKYGTDRDEAEGLGAELAAAGVGRAERLGGAPADETLLLVCNGGVLECLAQG